MKLKYYISLIFFLINTISSAQLSIEHHEPPTTLESMANYEFEVKYTSDRAINIFFEFKKGANTSYGFANTRVQAGTNQIIKVPITVSNLPPEGNDYFIRTYFWENNMIVSGTVTDHRDIQMTINVTQEEVSLERPPIKLYAQTSYNFDLNYAATQQRDIILELWSASEKLGETRKTVAGGSTIETLTLNLNKSPEVGEGYFYRAFVVPVGQDISMATASSGDLAGISVVDFLGEPCTDVIEETDGLVIIEAEDFDITNTSWQRKTVKTQYTGISYLEWLGNNYFGSPGNGIISAKIKITKTGKYRFQWRNRVGFGNSGTEHNDSWIKFPDVPAEDFYGEKPDGSRTYPRGSGLFPNPQGSSSGGWFKIYANSLDWNFNANTGDNADGRAVYVEFDTPGEYTLQISGRSKNHLIDRILLHNAASDPTNLENDSSNCSSALNISENDLKSFGVKVYPNPVNNVLYIKGVELKDKINVLDIFGRNVIKKVKVTSLETQQINISNLASGVYFLRIKNKGTQRIIKN